MYLWNSSGGGLIRIRFGSNVYLQMVHTRSTGYSQLAYLTRDSVSSLATWISTSGSPASQLYSMLQCVIKENCKPASVTGFMAIFGGIVPLNLRKV